MTAQDVLSLLNLYKSVFSGEQVDEAIGMILNGGITAAVKQAEASAAAAAQSAKDAAGSAADLGSAVTNANSAAGLATGSAVLSESYARGGTGERDGEDEDNSKYYAELAQAYWAATQQQAAVKAYGCVLADAKTGRKYALLVNAGALATIEVPDSVDATTIEFMDGSTGIVYSLCVEDGILKLKEE